MAYASLGKYRCAVTFYEQALAIVRDIGDRQGEGLTLWHMGLSVDQLGNRSQALTYAETALTIFEQIEDSTAVEVRRKLMQWRAEGVSNLLIPCQRGRPNS